MRWRVVVRGWPGAGGELETEGLAFREPWASPGVNPQTEAPNGTGPQDEQHDSQGPSGVTAADA